MTPKEELLELVLDCAEHVDSPGWRQLHDKLRCALNHWLDEQDTLPLAVEDESCHAEREAEAVELARDCPAGRPVTS